MAAPLPSADSPPLHPGAPKGPRGDVLVALKRAGDLTAKDLAERLGLSLNGVRHHLKELEAEGLVAYVRQSTGGVGAPAFAYRLTAAADALFPKRYEQALNAILDSLAEREGREAAVRMLEAHFASLAEGLRAEVAGVEPSRRLAIVVRALTEQGYMAEGELGENSGTLREHNCALSGVARRYPEICAAERQFLEQVLGGTVEREAHMLEGHCACQYRVQFTTRAATPPAIPEETA